MKGLILAGGAGTRLRPITHTSAKQLVPIANKPILFYVVEQMANAGIKEIGVVVSNGETGLEIQAALGDGSRLGVEVEYILQDEPLGLAHCVLIARDFLGDDDFAVYLGDNMLQQDLKTIVDRFEAKRSGQLALHESATRDAGRADPARARRQPSTVRCRRARPDRPCRAARREARRPALRPRARGRVSVRRDHPRGRARHHSVGAR